MFGGNVSGDMKLKSLLVYHSENPRALKNIAKGSLPVVWKSNPKVTGHFPGLVFPPLYPRGRETLLGEGHPIQRFSAARQCSGPPPIHARLASQLQNSASATEYYIALQPVDQGVTPTFKKYYLRHTFHQRVKASEKSGTTL